MGNVGEESINFRFFRLFFKRICIGCLFGVNFILGIGFYFRGVFWSGIVNKEKLSV